MVHTGMQAHCFWLADLQDMDTESADWCHSGSAVSTIVCHSLACMRTCHGVYRQGFYLFALLITATEVEGASRIQLISIWHLFKMVGDPFGWALCNQSSAHEWRRVDGDREEQMLCRL
jgi:hypothetical protein